MEQEIKILNLRMMSGKCNNPNLKAFFDLGVDGILIKDMKILEDDKGSNFIAGPKITFRDSSTGHVVRKSIVFLPSDLRDEVTRLVGNHLREGGGDDATNVF